VEVAAVEVQGMRLLCVRKAFAFDLRTTPSLPQAQVATVMIAHNGDAIGDLASPVQYSSGPIQGMSLVCALGLC